VNILEKVLHRAKNQFEHDFMREVLLSERRRVTILAGVLTGLLICGLLLNFFFGSNFQVALKDRNWAAIVLAIGAIYEFQVRRFFGYFIKLDRQPPAFARYGNALFETSLPTFLIAVFATFVDPVQALVNPISFMYFLFIILATLRLDFGLCLFTGAVAALEYVGLVFLYLDRLPPLSEETLATSLPMQLVKSFIFFLAGVIAGLVSLEIKKRFVRTITLLEERTEILHVFGQHVSPEVVTRLLNQPGEIDSETRYVCVMFLDIRNFTTFSENKSPAEVVNYLNTLFESMIDSVNRHRGIINKFLGDGFMAVFGAPLSDGQDCQNAVAAAREMLAQVEQLCATGQIQPTRIGIGLHAGEAITGNVGSSQRKEYTIIGDTVNLASRIEQLNKQYSSQLLVSEEVWNKVKEQILEGIALDPVQVKGRQAPVSIFKLA
jgi:adenylate cyclase